MKILSLFDGISCARVALERAGIPVEAYFASEIDKYAIQISKKNYPDIMQMGSVTDIRGEVLPLSGVYDILKSYDTNIQNHFSEQEMLYWLNEDFSISAKIGTQITNADSPESASLQRIEEIWFSRSGVGDIIKTQKLIGSRVIGENGNTQIQELLLQCGEWGYVYRSNSRNTQENIGRFDGKKTKTREYRENTTSGTFAMGNTTVKKEIIGTDEKRNVETTESQEISDRTKEPKEWGAETAGNRKEYARSKIQNVSFPLQTKNDNERITNREWLQLSVRKEMETTMVKTSNSIDIFLGKFEIMCGGSPCQDLSIAKKDRKGLDGERSGLFWEYVRILKEVKPKYFILENVNSMPKEAKELITKTLGVEPIMINASLVSAQNRKRLFWTNIPNVTQPEDRGILLKDILENGDSDRLKSYCIDANYFKGSSYENYKNKGKRQLVFLGGVRNKDWAKDGKDYSRNFGQGDRVYSPEGKSTTLSALGGGRGAKTGLYAVKDFVRKLTPVECERLQGLPDNFTEGISNTQRYKCLGNAFNVDVVAHILSFIPC